MVVTELLLLGLLGYATDDIRIREAFEHAKAAKLKYQFKSIGNALTYHPNTIKFNLTKGNRSVEVLGESKGGGAINIIEVDGFKAHFSAALHTLVVKTEDIKGSIAFIASVPFSIRM